MTSFASESLRLLRRILRGHGAPAPHGGKPVALDGISAVASLEARISEVAGLGATYPASLAARIWEGRDGSLALNAHQARITGISADSPRSALSAAIGAALAGRRATVFLSGPDLLACRDLVAQAAGRRVPLVIHAILRAAGGHAQALGSGHDAYHAIADLPCAQFLASSVQEVVDIAIVARKAAELALLPAIVAMDAEQTALALQDVATPTDDAIRSLLGSPHDVLPTPTKAQRMIFGDARRRIPKLYDLDRPMLVGPLEGPEAWALGAAAGRVYFEQELGRILAESAAAFAGATGRQVLPLRLHRVEGAEIILLAQGSLVEPAIAAADRARDVDRVKVGVIGISRLSPLDGAGIARALKGTAAACVLERVDSSPSAEGPLLQRLRSLLDRCRENAQLGATTHPALPALTPKEMPRLVNALAGLGGLPVRAADLSLLLRELAAPRRSLCYLGLEFARRASEFPKHQVLLDSIRRDFPAVIDLGLRGADAAPTPAGKGALTVAVRRSAGQDHEPVAGQFAALAYSVVGGSLRSRPAVHWQRSGQTCEDRFTLSPTPLCDPPDDVAIDLALLLTPGTEDTESLVRRLSADADIIVGADAITHGVSAPLAGALGRREPASRTLHIVPTPADADDSTRREALLGGALRVLLARRSAPPTAEQMSARRAEALHDLAAQDRDAALRAFAAGYEAVHAQAVDEPPEPARDAPADARVPSDLLRMAHAATGPGSLPRFWDHTGVFYETGKTGELIPEPSLALGTLPPLSAAFRQSGATGSSLPAFDPATCNGAPELWMTCPDGSVAPLAITPRALLDAGIDLATRAGDQADSLRPLASQLAKRAAKLALGDAAPTSAAALLQSAFDDVAAKLDATDERRQAMRDALHAVLRQIGDLPVAVTDAFFRDPERAAPGSGALLSLAINPDGCKAPELLLARGAGRGLVPVERTPETLAAARRAWDLWQRLPDTAGDIIERARKDSRIGPLAAMMLSRACLHAMAPGDAAEAGSGAKLALRQVLALAEFHYQPRTQKLLAQIAETRAKLSERIQSLLAHALPTADLNALAEGLEVLGRGDVALADLSARIDSAIVDGSVDGALLGRLVDLARALADLAWKLRTGDSGLGRARVGLVIAAGAAAKWTAAFPYNPFAVPAVVDACAEAGGLARGVLEASLREIIESFRLLRLAKIEMERPAEAPFAAARMAGLSYADLTDQERELVPPLLVVGDGQALGGRGLSQLVGLLESDLPIKAVILSDIGGHADGARSVDALGAYPPAQRFDTALLAMLTRKAFVTQASIACPDHFAENVERALATRGPALIHLHAPSPERHGFAVTRLFEQAALAVNSRAWPLFTFDPARPGVFGSCLDLSANPSPNERWTTDEDGKPVTPVHWAMTETRFAEQFRPLEPSAPSPTPIAEFLALDARAREGMTPFIEMSLDGATMRLHPGARLLQDALDRTRLWRTLEELSGVVTPFTESVRAEAERAVKDARQAEVAALTREHERRLADIRAEFTAEAAANVTSRLLALAGYADGRGS